MAFVKIMIHAVWGTKSSTPWLTGDIRPLVIEHIRQNARVKEFFIDRLNGYNDHLHCLMGLNAEMCIAKVMRLIKGGSAFWINKQGLVRPMFEWADEYFAVSVSESVLDKVRAYIDGREVHHEKKTFQQEYEEFMGGYSFFRQG